MEQLVPTTEAPAANRSRRWLDRLASPYLSVAFFLLMAPAALIIGPGGQPASLWLLLPFLLLLSNLLAAILVNRRFRADLPLLVFHVCLLAVVCLFVIARLTYLDAATTLTSGTEFDGRMTRQEMGAYHPRAKLAGLRFANEGLRARYSEDGTYRGTYNQVSWLSPQGNMQHAEIGDDRPLLLNDYRIYATVHRGLAPLFRWQRKGSPPEVGNIQLADHRAGEIPPSISWVLPGGPEAWVQLDVASIPRPQGRYQVDLGAAEIEHHLVLRIGDDRRELKIGDTVVLPEGELTYLRLNSWMSYRIVYDPATAWIMATVLVAVASLVAFYLRRLRQSGDEAA